MLFFCFGQESRWSRWLIAQWPIARVSVGWACCRGVSRCVWRGGCRGREGAVDAIETGRSSDRSLGLSAAPLPPDPSITFSLHRRQPFSHYNRSHPLQHAARGCHDRVRTHTERTHRTTGRERRFPIEDPSASLTAISSAADLRVAWVCGTCAMHGVRVCVLVLSVDNSEFTRNGDYAPTRFAAQNEAAGYLANAKLQVRTMGTTRHAQRSRSPAGNVGRCKGLRCR